MNLSQLTSSQRDVVLARWVEAFLATYPAEGAAHFQRCDDGFRNPVGATAQRALRELLPAVLGDPAAADARAVEDLMHLRAVQQIPPSRALAFVPAVRDIVREEAATECSPAELAALDRRVEAMLLRAVDAYVACRERIAELRARETRSSVYSLLRRARILADDEEPADEAALTGKPEGRS